MTIVKEHPHTATGIIHLPVFRHNVVNAYDEGLCQVDNINSLVVVEMRPNELGNHLQLSDEAPGGFVFNEAAWPEYGHDSLFGFLSEHLFLQVARLFCRQ